MVPAMFQRKNNGSFQKNCLLKSINFKSVFGICGMGPKNVCFQQDSLLFKQVVMVLCNP